MTGRGSPADGRPGRPSGYPSPRRIVPLWVAIGFVTGFVLLAIANTFGTPVPTASATPAGSETSAPGSGTGAVPGGRLVAVGLVTNIDASSPVDVRSFTLRADDGQTIVFTIVPGVDTGFPPGHLQEHRASGAKVLVTFHVAGGQNLVDGLDDAPVASPIPS